MTEYLVSGWVNGRPATIRVFAFSAGEAQTRAREQGMSSFKGAPQRV